MQKADITKNNRLVQGGVIKRAYVPHDVTPLLAVVPSTRIPVPTAEGQKYYNTTTKRLYTAYNDLDEMPQWNTGSTPTEDRIFIDISTNRLYHWHESDMYQVGGGGSSLEGLEFEED